MQAEEIVEVSSSSCLNNLDMALNELGMLATSSNSRHEYLNEVQLNMVSREYDEKHYVKSNFRERRIRNIKSCKINPGSIKACLKDRYQPYNLPLSRHRTKSENNDKDNTTPNLAQVIVEECINQSLVEMNQLKKAKSLESIIAECSENENDLITFKGADFQHCFERFELEMVSDSIQNLKVNE